MRSLPSGFARLLVAGTLAAAVAPAAEAQYFGRNQVQYRTFDFQILETAHFDVYFYPEERELALTAGRMAERWYARLSRIFADSLTGRQPLILYAAHPHFEQTNVIEGELSEGTGGVTESFKRRIVLPAGASLAETDHVLGHELVHAFQYDITGRGRSSAPGAAVLPLWFIEGMAEYLSLGPVDPQTAMWIRDAMGSNHLPRIRDLDNPRYFPYRYGHAFWAYVGGRYGDESVGAALRAAARARDAGIGLRNVLGLSPDSLSAQWHAAIRAAYEPVVASTRAAADNGQPLLTEGTTGGRMSLAPALSPDGSRIVFLSERERFSIEMFVADAATGRVLRRLTRTALDPHLESIQFINSAGGWSPDGRSFVFASIVRGKPALQIMNPENGDGTREIRITELDEVFNPSYAPDGNRLVFTAQAGGQTDLYTYDLRSNELARLTNDAFADLEPAFSPDGSQIAFVSDRFGTDGATLRYGAYRLALLDVASGRITPVPGFNEGKQINPQWSADGRSLFFIADPDGISNVYRLEVASGGITRVTNLSTGASGITALSPALSVAASGDVMAVTIYQNDRHEVYRIAGAEAMAGAAVSAPQGLTRTATLPGANVSESRVASYIADVTTGLPASDGFTVRAYRPRFGLDYVAPPSLTAGADRFGTYVGGGSAVFWSSMLGDRKLATSLQVNGGLRDISAAVTYVNQRRRLDWGIAVSQVPYLSGGFGETSGTVGGQPAVIFREELVRQTNRQVAVLAAYPLSRALRIEGNAGVRHISFGGEVRTIAVDANTGEILEDRDSTIDLGPALTLGEASAAMVFDNSIFGGTGPVLGGRMRLEAAPTIGALQYLGVLADARKYFMPLRPITLAARVLHYGRYGSGGEDPRLTPVFIGYQGLVRGYDNGSFTADECTSTPSSTCPEFDRLVGSRMLVSNAELRLPVFGPLGVVARNFLPIELGWFVDGGVAWNRGESPSAFGGAREFVASTGATARINFFGAFIAQIDYVHPLDRPRKGWYFQFGLIPGF